jgi:murein DD-endopeptidase MepM/ murein hydrolase activator NlpD
MDNREHNKWKQFGNFLKKKYRFVILNDNTFAEKISIRMSPWGIIIGSLAITIIMTSLVISFVAFTPLREYIPGYGNVSERKQILKLSLQADSLEQTLEARELYLNTVLNVLNEKVETKSAKPLKDTTGRYSKLNTKASAADQDFRSTFERERQKSAGNISRLKYSVMSELVFFAPVGGYIVNSFDLKQEHYGIDVVTGPDEIIRSTLDGTIIYEGFSSTDGNVLHVQHSNNIVSIYKHCSSFLKRTGDRIRAGDAIAIVGNTGEKSSGPHLHFELWFNGQPVNPQEFVAF